MKDKLSNTINLVWPNDYKSGSAVLPPLGLGYIASYLMKQGLYVKIYDYTFNSNLELSKEKAIYGVSITTPILNIAEKVIKKIKEINKNNIIIVGGVHATNMPQQLINNKDIDYVIFGEGEKTFYNLCKTILKNESVKNILGVYYKDNKGVHFTGAAEFIENLDELPFPNYDLFPIQTYIKSKPIKELNIITSRGCPFNCIFCQPYLKKMFGDKIRYRSPKNVVDEIEQLKKKYNPDIFFFCDDMVNPNYIENLCKEFINNKLRIIWRCQARACLDKKLLKLMKKAGCVNIAFGVESGSQKVLNAINKGLRVEDVVRQFNDCRKVGIFTHAFLMVGNPTENMDDINKTIELVKKIKPFSIYVSITTPYPGTYLFNQLQNEKKLPEKIDWSSMHHLKDDTFYIDISDMSKEEIVKAKHLILDGFRNSSKLSRFYYIISYIKNWDGVKNILFFILEHPLVIFNVLKTFISISKSGSGLDATNPESDFFDKKNNKNILQVKNYD